MKDMVVFKKLSLIMLVVLLPVMLWMSTQASISGDEFLHRDQAEAVVDFFLSSGANQKALDTPVTNLKHYGQSYDNLASFIARIFSIEDIFLLRHLMSAFAGWLVILFAFLMATKTGGWGTAFFTMVIFSISASFIGHSLNNLKDIPFALGYMAGIYAIYNLMCQWPYFKLKTAWLMVAAIAFSISIRPPGIILIAYLGLAIFILAIKSYHKKELFIKAIVVLFSKSFLIMAAGYFAGLLLWPYALQNPFKNPFISHQIMEAYPVTIRQLLMGNMIWSDMLPDYYLPWMMLISVPLLLLLGLLMFIVFQRFKYNPKAVAILLFSILFPVIFILFRQSNVYGGWRHILFIYPPLSIIAGFGLHAFYQFLRIKANKILWVPTVLFVGVLIAEPLGFMIRNHPFHYLYFNPVAGGYKGAYAKYEADYYFNTIHPAAEWLNNYILQTGEENIKVISNFEAAWHFRKNKQVSSVLQSSWYNRANYDWDYAVFSATYVHAHTLTNGLWPPPGTIHTINVENLPVAAVVKRISKDDFRGWEALKRHQLIEAKEFLASSVAVDSSNEGAWLNYSRTLYQLGDYEDALLKVNKALKINPLFEPALLEKARGQLQLGTPEEALSTLDFLLKNNVKYLPAWELKATILAQAGKKAEAVHCLKKALAIQPAYKPAHDKLLELTEKY